MRVAIYVRVSTKDGRQDTANQLNQLQSFVKGQLGWTLVKTYKDAASGKSRNREEFQAMLQDAQLRKFDLLLFWSLDRLTREGVLETLMYLAQFSEWGVHYRSLTEQYLDSCGVFKDAVIGILATIAKQERIRISERTIAGQQRMIQSGKPGPNGYYKPGRPRLNVDLEKLSALRSRGWEVNDLASHFKVSRATILRICSANGISRVSTAAV